MARNTIATAYVQILPSTEGIGSSLKTALSGNDVASAGEGAGLSIVSKIKGRCLFLLLSALVCR